MTDSNVIEIKKPATDVLQDVLKLGARDLLAKAIEAEVIETLAQFGELKVDGKQAVVRNGYLPERTIQTGLGDIPVQVPKVRDRSGQGIRRCPESLGKPRDRSDLQGISSIHRRVSQQLVQLLEQHIELLIRH